jgi:hypothetical protein
MQSAVKLCRPRLKHTREATDWHRRIGLGNCNSNGYNPPP